MIDYPLSDVVSETASSFQALALRREKRFEMDVGAELMLSINGSEKQIRSACLTAENTTDAVLSKEALDNMFDRFYRGNPSRNSATSRCVIGLSIAKAVVEAREGQIVAALRRDSATLPLTRAPRLCRI